MHEDVTNDAPAAVRAAHGLVSGAAREARHVGARDDRRSSAPRRWRGCADVDVAPTSTRCSAPSWSGRESVRWWRRRGRRRPRRRSGTLAHDLTADDAVRIALLNDRELQAAFEELGIGKADLVAAGRPKNPALHTEIRFPGAPRAPFEVDVTQDFLELLLLPQRSAAAKAQFEATRLRVTQTVLDVAARARAAFITYQSAEQLAARQRDAARAADAAADAARRLTRPAT